MREIINKGILDVQWEYCVKLKLRQRKKDASHIWNYALHAFHGICKPKL